MTTEFLTFSEALAHACGLLQATDDRDVLRSQYDHWSGVLRGYFLGGAVCRVVAEAALEQLRTLYVERFDATSPNIPRRGQVVVVEGAQTAKGLAGIFRHPFKGGAST
jgi:hypothetical protein